MGAAPPGYPEAQPPPPSSEHKEPVAGDAVLGPKDVSALEVRAARNSEPQDEGELFQGVDPRALAAVLLQALDRPAETVLYVGYGDTYVTRYICGSS